MTRVEVKDEKLVSLLVGTMDVLWADKTVAMWDGCWADKMGVLMDEMTAVPMDEISVEKLVLRTDVRTVDLMA